MKSSINNLVDKANLRMKLAFGFKISACILFIPVSKGFVVTADEQDER